MNKILLAGLLMLGAAPAFAAPQISPQSIIVNPIPAQVGVSVWTDKDPSGTRTPDYYPGERIRLYVSTTRDAYVYLFNVDPNGQVDLILPNRYSGGDNFVRGGTTKVFPPSNAGFTFDIATPYGVNKVLALASTTPLNLDDIARFRSGQNSGFAEVTVRTQTGLAQALSIVVNPIPQNSWITDTAYYNVAGGNVYNPAPDPYYPPQPDPYYPDPYYPDPYYDGYVVSHLGLRLYPGARLVERNDTRDAAYVKFDTGARLNDVLAYYEGEMRRLGFRTDYRRSNRGETEVRFSRGRESVRMNLQDQGRGRFYLRLVFDY
ncbi:hypothetical protein HNR42_002534 [Deinobacterium chartae]|uniref:DUF4384 domain-containing protein n=1 Tax=Deinobacterium chartae TaxID=521158 RepID=A0A841I3Y7_9DEIO|nr:DUF4384 domain-containing protein [Deinobacterium chartae]MBB6099098.1 hypothetical protein [Deinobacterium chartae]